MGHRGSSVAVEPDQRRVGDGIAFELAKGEAQHPAGEKKSFFVFRNRFFFQTGRKNNSKLVLLKKKHKTTNSTQIAIIFAGYQFAGTAGALVGGNVMTIYGLRSTLMAALALQATATAAFIPMRHAHKSFGTKLDVHPTHVPTMTIAAATAYATVIQLFNGLARVLVRLGTKTLPRLVTPDLKKSVSRNTAGKSERGLMWKSAMVNGGRTFVRGGGALLG